MGRPTDERKEKTVKLRISGELYEEIEQRGDNISETIRRLIRDGLNYVPHKKIETSKENVPQKPKEDIQDVSPYVSDETRKDVEQMCHLSGVSTVYFNDEVCRLFNEGKIEFDCMKLKSKGEYDLSYLLDVCHRINADPQEMINKLANSLVRR